MKSIIINENQENLLIKEAMMQNFSIDTLYSLPSYSAKVKYCKQMLGNPIGNGTSRMVFQIDDETVLKLAKNDKGIAQNEQEGQPDWYLETLGVTPKVYHDYNKTDDYTFIVSEYVIPAKKQDFIHCLGIDYDTFCRFIIASYNQYARKKDWRGLNDYTFCELIEQNDDLRLFNDYMTNYQVNFGDIVRLANLGMVQRDGEAHIVILDSGLNDDIYYKFYRKK